MSDISYVTAFSCANRLPLELNTMSIYTLTFKMDLWFKSSIRKVYKDCMSVIMNQVSLIH